MKCKAFNQILLEVNDRPEKLRNWLADKRLTNTEKKLVLAYSWLRNNEHQRVLDEVALLPTSEIDFVEAHRRLLLGVAANNLANFTLATAHLGAAAAAFEKLSLHAFHFTARFNLFILASNRGVLGDMRAQLSVLRGIPAETKLQGLRLLRAEFIFADEAGDVPAARAWLAKLNAVRDQLPEAEIVSQLVSEFMFFVAQEQLAEAHALLAELKKHRKFQLSENYNYMKKLVEHLLHDARIYAYAADFAEVPLLYYQLEVIQSLEAADKNRAQTFWAKLAELIPEHFADGFTYRGRTCLFSLALKRHQGKQKPVLHVESSDRKVDQLLKILAEHPEGIRKDHLFELLWGEHPETKDQLMRLTRLVYKAKQETGIEIISKKGSYNVGAPNKKLAV